MALEEKWRGLRCRQNQLNSARQWIVQCVSPAAKKSKRSKRLVSIEDPFKARLKNDIGAIEDFSSTGLATSNNPKTRALGNDRHNRSGTHEKGRHLRGALKRASQDQSEPQAALFGGLGEPHYLVGGDFKAAMAAALSDADSNISVTNDS